MRKLAETNAVNRILKAWGLGSLDEPDAVPALARMVQDHDHFGEILRACDPQLRKEMYDAMSPNLRFKARSLDWYMIGAKEHAESMQYPTLDAEGNLHPFMPPSIGTALAVLAPPEEELIVECSKCKAINFFYGARRVDAIVQAREAGWAYDEAEKKHLCAECLEKLVAQDKEGG
jgi:hypothetical protein